MKHVKPEAWSHQEMTPIQTAAWYKQQSDDQIRVLTAHNVWYGPEHLRPRNGCPLSSSEPDPEPDIEPDTPLSMMPVPAAPLVWTRRVTVAEIIAACAAVTKVNIDEIKSMRRSLTVSKARHMVMYLAKKHTVRSLSEIGRMLGGKDHSTVIHGRNRVQEDLDSGGEIFGAMIAESETKLGLR